MTAPAATSSLGLTWPADGMEGGCCWTADAGDAEERLEDVNVFPLLLPLPMVYSDASLGFLRGGGAMVVADDDVADAAEDGPDTVAVAATPLCACRSLATHCLCSLVSIMDPSRLHGMSVVIP